MKKQLISLIAATLLAAAPLFSQSKGANPISTNSTNSTGQTRAVVIGISDYQEKDIPDLRFADKDALAFANFLRSPAAGSLDNDHLQVLTNENATSGLVAAALDALIEQTKEGDEVIIYFSGHGDVERKIFSQPGFLLCWDAPARVYMGGGTFGLAYLEAIVTTLSVQNMAKVLVITDACHAGKLAGSQIGGAQLTSANLAKQYSNEVKILSCQPNEFSLEGEQWGGGRGVFSFHLVDGLFGLADKNGDAAVSLFEIGRYLEDKVTAEAAPQSQIPMLLGNKTERLATVNAGILAELKKAKSGGMPIFTATEGRGLEDDVLAKLDSGIVKKYFAFKKAVAERRFFEPENDCAEAFYASLSTEPRLAPLHGFLKRNYAAALQDGAQQVMNNWLKADPNEVSKSAKRRAREYQTYPICLRRASELLGAGHYMYPSIKAREALFEGYLIRLGLTKIPLEERGGIALSLFRQALSWQPDLPQAYWFISQTFGGRLNQPDSAWAYGLRAAELAPNWVLPYTSLVAQFTEKYHNDVLSDSLLAMLWRIDPNSVLVLNTFGFHSLMLWQEGKGDLKDAEQYFLKGVAIDSTSKGCVSNLGLVYRLTSRFVEAERYYIKALQIDPDAPTYNEYGLLCLELNRNEEAEFFFNKAIEYDSSFVYTYGSLSLMYRKSNRFAEAETASKKYIYLQPQNPNGYMDLSLIYVRVNRPEEAILNAKTAIDLNDGVNTRYNMACVYSLLNRPAEAFENLELTLKFGFDYDWLQSDLDLAPLRPFPAWKVLMKKHFPDKAKD